MEVYILSLSVDSPENKPYYLPLLLLISIVAHFPFVLKGFGEIDATKIAVSVIDILNHGPDAAFSNFYFAGVIPLYILYLKSSMKLLNYDYSYLPLVMNYTNAVVGTLIIIPAYLLIKKLFRHSTVAFCSVLALIFAPSFYQSTIMGFPHLISFFFFLLSLSIYLSALDHSRKSTGYLLMFLSCIFLTVAFLFKSDIVLAAGIYVGFLFMRKENDKGKIVGTFLMIFIAGVLFLLIRNLILGPGSGGTTMSKEGMSKWYHYSLIIPSNLPYLIRQVKPIAYGAGIVTFCLGAGTFLFYLFKRRFDMLFFILSWAAIPVLFWLVMIGNNARHNMITTLPLLVMIAIFFHEKAPRFLFVLTALLVLGNFLVTPASFSILTPSGNLFKSNILLKERMIKFQTSAKQIAHVNDDKIAVLGYFHNPHVVFELISSADSYEAFKIGREDYKIRAGNREYVFIYLVVLPEKIVEGLDRALSRYNLHDHVFVSATYDLQPLEKHGFKTRKIDKIIRSAL
jgi:hypothetical protein